jgi:hypothetical protein
MAIRMLSGFNHNIKHNGRTYHIQTEDGGRTSPNIVTHTFIGGVILDSVRTSYADLVETPGWQDRLKDRMKAQHLEEIRKLLSGAIPLPDDEEAPGDA